MQKTLKVGSRITLQDQLQLMMQIELLNGGFYDEYNFHKGTFRADLTGKCSYVVACQN
ncbi:Uncharacterised protein [Citrobacter koseri]|nr:Uncharacterised protein [Citrobacter koseri]